jgi:hypothetical protein
LEPLSQLKRPEVFPPALQEDGGSDYTLIDNAVNRQATSLVSELSGRTADRLDSCQTGTAMPAPVAALSFAGAWFVPSEKDMMCKKQLGFRWNRNGSEDEKA